MSRFDKRRFLFAWLRAPLRIASITPSGARLAGLMTKEISPAAGPVLELGPGTGVFTGALLKRGIAESDLTLVEYEADFAALLQGRFPSAKVLQLDVREMWSGPLSGRFFGSVVSGLPLLSMKPDDVYALLEGCFSNLRPYGAFYQFTYGPKCPVPAEILDSLGLVAAKIGRTLRNIPPAAVYRISRRYQPLLQIEQRHAS
ncbi:methyltransferase domain-containing protein [Rhizobium lentis]|uniref:class I SAM-dependent methyltransferase n=1 Tax=Rhizobium lentis TaxID=1138194 RepID=UPI001C82B257|nr:methyltransferase domain-containing protein [Rhizobium lentis]MBX5042188.1 methyltransferase domain-containing protein [Rhizobium lentis]MBX5053183.1 methyltransferase domain-containing protein [Rhizobium lentis]MBX5074822.1 methyltransferase domain-containing protein [Rhizobium lentis]MBX5112234.1 methyltransferase domain-containing protein [Rhizobium lentis]MBX5115314.1 methyltransferase domain-containing protein [Rhizobium lentis]